MTVEEKREHYLGCDIYATKYEDTKGLITYQWILSKNGKFLMGEVGAQLQSMQHAINDCKKNIDSLIRINSLK